MSTKNNLDFYFKNKPIRFFISATDTDVGKTYASSHIIKALGNNAGYFKPFQSGLEDIPDGDIIKQNCSDVIIKNSYVTKTPATPALSAEIDGVEISLDRVKQDYENLCAQCDNIIIEGSGGLFVPVAPKILMSDVILALDLPMLIIARPDLGTINHTLLTIYAAQNLGIKVLGVVMTYPPKLSSKRYIEEFSDCKVQLLDEFIQTLCRLSQV